MSTAHRLLTLLADGAPHPRSRLATALGVSPTSVSRAIGTLRGLGLDLTVRRGSGYTMRYPFDVLREAVMLHQIDPAVRPRLAGIDICLAVGSTNDYLLARPACEPAQAFVCLAETQTSGRGRRGRTWNSPFGSNLYLSIQRDFTARPHLMQGLSLAVGVWVAETVAALGIPGVRLKWPNDLLLGGEKFGGILTELVNTPTGGWRMVCGVGINVSMPARGGAGIEQPWTDLASTGCPVPGRNLIAGCLINRVLEEFVRFERQGFAVYRDAWLDLDIGLHQDVVLHTPNAEIPGICRGVDQHGALLLDTGEETRAFVSGEVSVRLRT